MNFDPLSGVLKTWTWAQEHWYYFVIGGLVALGFLLLWYAYKRSTEEESRRDAVKRAMKEVFGSASASGASARWLTTRGNAQTRTSLWGRILGARETSHAVFVHAMPARGVFKWFQRRRCIIARHLVGDTRSVDLEVTALGFTPYEDVWIPDDDFHDADIVAEWRSILIESGEDAANIDNDLPSCVLHWYLRIIKAETFARAAVRSFDDIAYNWHTASSAVLTQRRSSASYESPSMSADKQDRDRAREQEAQQHG